MEINITKIFLLAINKDQKRRKETPAPDLEINGECLPVQTMIFDDAYRYLGYRKWGHECDKESGSGKDGGGTRSNQMPPAHASSCH